MFLKYIKFTSRKNNKIRYFVFLILNLLVINNYLFLDLAKSNQIKSEKIIVQNQTENKDKYIIGPGDQLLIYHNELPEYSGNYTIGPDGSLILPEIFQIYVEGFTLDELRQILTEKYKKYIKDPDLFIAISRLRPVRVYLSGEVRRPGYYTISSYQNLSSFSGEDVTLGYEIDKSFPSGKYSENILPTVFDSIRAAQGLTTYSDLSNIEVIRKNIISDGGGYLKTELNFLSLINGDQSQNIRVFDGDRIIVKKSEDNPKNQFLKILKTNISPSNITVYVTGKVADPGPIIVPQGSGLNQGIALAGGKNFLSGNIQFLRFNDSGDLEKRNFRFNRKEKLSSYKNPILVEGDIIHVKGSIIGNTTQAINTFAGPVFATYSLYNLFYE